MNNGNINNDAKINHRTFRKGKVILPLLISLCSLSYIYYENKNLDNLHLITSFDLFPFAVSILMLFIRDFLYVYRIRVLTSQSICWSDCLLIIILWEFISAVTPTTLGGTFISAVLFYKSGINLGKSLAFVMIIAMLDNLTFLIISPIGYKYLLNNENFLNSQLLQYSFLLSYTLMAFYTLFMFISLFVYPKLLPSVILRLFKIKFLSKYYHKVKDQMNNLTNASQYLKGYSVFYWLKILIITFVIWSSRYLILNFVSATYVNLSLQQHIDIFFKHIVMWVATLISPTPGSTGTTELFFNALYSDTLKNCIVPITLIWRCLTYYVYLIVGIILLPKLLNKK